MMMNDGLLVLLALASRNDATINNSLLKLKSGSSACVYEGLVEIRTHINRSETGVKLIREKDYLKYLVKFLHKPNEKILDVTLSILGNCCLESESRYEVGRRGIVKPLVTVLRNINRDSIQGRTCRLIGNLAQCSSIAVKLHQENVVGDLVSVVDVGTSSSSPTRQMAVRALRILWDVEAQRANMLELNAVRKVALLLSAPQEEQELLKVVLKALAVFTSHCSERCARQVHADGSGFQSLLSLITNIHLKDSIILCICNLSHISNSRPILGAAGAVKIIVKELLRQDCYKTAPSELHIALVSTLCLLCRESVNRAKIRRAGGLPIILSILRDSSMVDLQIRALYALVQFVYDETSLQELLREGMVSVLVTKLGNIVKEHGNVHKAMIPDTCKNSLRSTKRRLTTVCQTENVVEDEKKVKKSLSVNIKDFSAKEPNTTADFSLADPNGSWEGLKRFRVSSPSYQAVVHEQGGSYRHKDRGSNTSSSSPNHSTEFTFSSSSPEQPSPNKQWSPEGYMTGDWSPGSPRSMCFSPDSSPPPSYRTPISSPTSSSPLREMWSSSSSPTSRNSMDSDWPEVYSPVCFDAPSDDDDEDEDVKECSLLVQDKSEDPNTDSVGKCEPPDWTLEYQQLPSSKESQPSSVEEGPLLVLLSRISHMETPVEEMAVQATLITLLDYVSLLRNPVPRAARVLGRVVRNQHYFLRLLNHQFVLNVHGRLCRPLHDKCAQCNKLSSLGHSLLGQISMMAESGFGEGELAHQMLKADDSVRRMLAVTVPYIVKVHRLLRKLLISCKGLDILEQILNSSQVERNDLMDHVPSSLALLATSLNICSPHGSTTHENDCLHRDTAENICKEIVENSDGDIVIFILDDGSSVPASKNFLCKHSPVFDAMLQGSFKESEQQSVRLQAISKNSLHHLIYLIKQNRVPHCLPELNLSAAVDLLLTLDRFLVDGSDQLTDLIVRQFLGPDTASSMYTYAVNMGNLKHLDYIREKTLEFILASDITSRKRDHIFTELLQSSCGRQMSVDILDLLRQSLVATASK